MPILYAYFHEVISSWEAKTVTSQCELHFHTKFLQILILNYSLNINVVICAINRNS